MKRSVFTFFSLCLLVLWTSVCLGQTENQTVMSQKNTLAETFLGKITRKPWSKSTESYCAGGSDYYWFEGPRARFVLELNEKWTEETIQPYLNAPVEITGVVINKEIADNGSPYEQRPVSFSPDGKKVENQPFKCQVLKPIDMKTVW